MVDQVGQLARAVIRVDGHTTHAQRIHGQLVQHVFRTAFQQQADPVRKTVARLAIAGRQGGHGIARLGVAQLQPLRVVITLRIGGNRHQGQRVIRLDRRVKGLSNRCVIGNRYHSYSQGRIAGDGSGDTPCASAATRSASRART